MGDEALQFFRILSSVGAFDTCMDIDSCGSDGFHGAGDVVRVQSSGEDEGSFGVAGVFPAEGPVVGFSCCT